MNKLAVERDALLHALRERGYHFVTPTPATHARVVARADKRNARDLRDVFGWSLPFAREAVDAEIVVRMEAAETLAPHGELFISRVRVSSLDGDLFLHSAYPTTKADAVFFGPDSYRFASFLRTELPALGPIEHLVDIGAGSGVGAVAALHATELAHLTLTDVNPDALDLAMANLFHANQRIGSEADLTLDFANTSVLDGVERPINAVIANPPYIIDASKRTYRDGGAMHGAEVSLAWAKAAADRLERGGALLLYTGSAIVNGEDRFKAALHQMLCGFEISYRELDPDVFGEELEREDYADVERIAVVGVVAVKR